MTGSILKHICYPVTEAAVIAQAEDKAKEQGKSFSKYVMNLIEADLKKKEQPNILPIMSKEHQSLITEFSPHLFNDNVERKQLYKWVQNLGEEKLREFKHQVDDAQNMIKSRRFNEWRIRNQYKNVRNYLNR